MPDHPPTPAAEPPGTEGGRRVFLFYCPEVARRLGKVAIWQDAAGVRYRCTEVMDVDRFLDPHVAYKPAGDLIGLGVRFLGVEVLDPATVERNETFAKDLASAAMTLEASGVPVDQTIKAMYRAIHSEAN